MAAVTRWINYAVSASGVAGDGRAAGCVGTKGYSIGTTDPTDTITIGSTTNRLYLNLDGESGPYVTLYSGSDLDPRFVARDITEKLHNLGKNDERWDNAVCRYENTSADGNRLKIYSGTLGSSSNVFVATSGTNSAHSVLGFDTKTETGGDTKRLSGESYNFTGDVSISGSYYGLFDETYTIIVSNDNDATRGIGTPSKGGGNSYAGTMTTGGVYFGSADDTYTISIDDTNGTTMGAGTGNVPTMSWTSSPGSDDSSSSTELLYPDHWYKVGTKGLMVKFTDAVFNTASPAWTINCYAADYAQGSNTSAPVGTAEYVWSSDRGDDSSGPEPTVSGGYSRLGTRGLYIKFNPTGPSDYLEARDSFQVICAAPKPSDYNITSLNYGNVTVSTESDVKCVMFEIESGAAQMSSVKFGLQSHGSFSHHGAGNGNEDTYFRFGTVGPGNNGGSGNQDGKEWWPNVVAADIDNDSPPDYLYATDDDLQVVATADASESIGNYPMCGMTSDPVWLGIRLGASETGANSSINYRLYFDYS